MVSYEVLLTTNVVLRVGIGFLLVVTFLGPIGSVGDASIQPSALGTPPGSPIGQRASIRASTGTTTPVAGCVAAPIFPVLPSEGVFSP